MNPVGQTAQWMAAVRAQESARPDRLFDDPFAAALAGEVTLPTRSDGSANDFLYPILRTRFFDDFLQRVTGTEGIRQVVLLGAGLDARAFRLTWPAGTRLYELDQPEVLALKESILSDAGAQARCARVVLGQDLAQPWGAALVAAGFAAHAPSVWLIEGVLPYLAPPTVDALLAQVTTLAAPGSQLGADLPNAELLRSAWTRDALSALAERGSPWLFGTDEPEELFAPYGWQATVTAPGEASVLYRPWPYPLVPRHVPGIPHYFLVQARREPSQAPPD